VFYLGSINWSNIYNNIYSIYNIYNINDNLDTFYFPIDCAINNFIPKNRRHNLSYPYWFSKKLKILIKEKQNAHLILKTLKTPVSYFYFYNIRKKCKTTIDIVIKNYFLIKFNQSQLYNLYILVTYIFYKTTKQLPASMFYNNTEASIIIIE